MTKQEEQLGTERPVKLIFMLAVPSVAAQFINVLYNIVDRLYIGHIPEIGATALTGVGVCMPLIMIVSAFAALVGYGRAPDNTTYLYYAADHPVKSDYGSLFGRTYRGCDRGDIYGNPVCSAV